MVVPESVISLIYFCTLLQGCQTSVPMVIGTWGSDSFQAATEKAFETLLEENNRIQSLLVGLTTCEQLQCDGTVGFGGSPDERGETRLDALVFDGPGHEMGAVGSMPNVKNAAHVAYAVMKHTRHSLLVGDHAANFAVEMGFKNESLYTNTSRAIYQKWLEENCQPNYWINVEPDPTKYCGPYHPVNAETNIQDVYLQVGRDNHDTIGLIVIDYDSNIAAGTSTNGLNHKVPGRLGDAPIPGAGAYVDNDVGGAASTGDGDIMMRFLPSFQTVQHIREGLTPWKATEKSIRAISSKYSNFKGAVIAANKKGEFGAACYGFDTFSFCVQNRNFEKVKMISVKCVEK